MANIIMLSSMASKLVYYKTIIEASGLEILDLGIFSKGIFFMQ